MFSACGSDAPADGESSDGPALRVAASFAVLADIVHNVAGDRAEVWSVVPANAEPHAYEASPQDLARLSEADLLVMVGGRFEPFAERTPWLRAAREANVTTLTVTDSIEVIETESVVEHDDHAHEEGEGDPHFWLDPQRVMEMLPLVADALADLDSAGAEAYRENAAAYEQELEALDADLEAAMARIPAERRVLVVHHNAYNYLAQRFDFTVVGSVLPSSGESELSAAQLADLYRAIEDLGVQAVFREPQYESAVLEQLASDHGIEVGVLMTDAFTDDADTYIELMRFNIESLVTHLG